jgi:chitinase
MRLRAIHQLCSLITVLLAFCCLSSSTRADIWSTAYYAAWLQGTMPASNVDYTVLTHVIHFSIEPKANGSLNTGVNGITPSYSTDLVTRAHNAGKKVLICVGGGGTQANFQGATSTTNRTAFINNLISFMNTYNYDGIDLDWEPLDSTDANLFTNLVINLRSAMTASRPQSLLTAAAQTSSSAIFYPIRNQFDQINIMTYDLSGPWPGWITWFNSPIYDGGTRFPSTHGLVPSIDGSVNAFIAAGIPAGKIGIGIPFYGYIWSGGAGTTNGGVAFPRESYTTDPTVVSCSYNDIMTNYQAQFYRWDTNAQAACLTIDNSGSANDKFISYDDEHACQAKVSYARNRGLGGIMIFDLGNGYRINQPAGKRDPLLQAVKQALATPRFTSLNLNNQTTQLNFSTSPLGLYRVLWTSNLAGSSWNTLTNNLSGNGTNLQVIDSFSPVPAQRFYRVQTPP